MKKAVIFDLFGVLVQNGHANDELIALAGELKKKEVKIFVLSNADEELAVQQKSQFAFLSEVLDHFYYSGKTGFVKPDPQAFQLILQENNLKPAEVIYFDDNAKHVAAAQALGIKSHVFVSAEDIKQKIEEV